MGSELRQRRAQSWTIEVINQAGLWRDVIDKEYEEILV